MYIDRSISNWEAQNAEWKRWYPRDDVFLQPRMFHDGALLPRWHAQPNVILVSSSSFILLFLWRKHHDVDIRTHPYIGAWNLNFPGVCAAVVQE